MSCPVLLNPACVVGKVIGSVARAGVESTLQATLARTSIARAQ